MSAADSTARSDYCSHLSTARAHDAISRPPPPRVPRRTVEGGRRLPWFHTHQLLHDIHKLAAPLIREEQWVVALHAGRQAQPTGAGGGSGGSGNDGVSGSTESSSSSRSCGVAALELKAALPPPPAAPTTPTQPTHLPAYSICLYTRASMSVG